MKGQYFTLDVIVAALIGIVGMLLLLGYWQYSLENSPLISDSLNKEAIKASQLLFTSYGDYAVLDENGRLTSLDRLGNRVTALSRSQPYSVCVATKDEQGTLQSLPLPNCRQVAVESKLMAKVERVIPYEILIPPSTPNGDVSYNRGILFVEVYVYYP